jgi:Tfp pilus assembly protein PilO
MPEYKTFGKLQTQLGEKKAEYNAEFVYYNAIAKTYDDLKKHKDDIQKIDDALPQESDLGRIIYSLQKIATESGMMVKSLFLSKSPAGNFQGNVSGGVKDLSFSINTLGDYASLQKFIYSLERSSRIFEVTSISFGSASGQSSESSQTQFKIQQAYSFSLQIKTHSY